MVVLWAEAQAVRVHRHVLQAPEGAEGRAIEAVVDHEVVDEEAALRAQGLKHCALRLRLGMCHRWAWRCPWALDRRSQPLDHPATETHSAVEPRVAPHAHALEDADPRPPKPFQAPAARPLTASSGRLATFWLSRLSRGVHLSTASCSWQKRVLYFLGSGFAFSLLEAAMARQVHTLKYRSGPDTSHVDRFKPVGQSRRLRPSSCNVTPACKSDWCLDRRNGAGWQAARGARLGTGRFVEGKRLRPRARPNASGRGQIPRALRTTGVAIGELPTIAPHSHKTASTRSTTPPPTDGSREGSDDVGTLPHAHKPETCGFDAQRAEETP